MGGGCHESPKVSRQYFSDSILPLDDQMLLGSTPLIPEAKILRKLVALGRVAPRKLFFSF